MLTGTEDYHYNLRILLCNYIESTQTLADATYIARNNMRFPGIWATDIEILALSSFLHCNIYVYSSVGSVNSLPSWLKFSPLPGSPSPFSQYPLYSLYINHANQNHYEPVLDIEWIRFSYSYANFILYSFHSLLYSYWLLHTRYSFRSVFIPLGIYSTRYSFRFPNFLVKYEETYSIKIFLTFVKIIILDNLSSIRKF